MVSTKLLVQHIKDYSGQDWENEINEIITLLYTPRFMIVFLNNELLKEEKTKVSALINCLFSIDSEDDSKKDSLLNFIIDDSKKNTGVSHEQEFRSFIGKVNTADFLERFEKNKLLRKECMEIYFILTLLFWK